MQKAVFAILNHIQQLIRGHQRPLLYILVGGINTGVDFGVFHLFYLFTPLLAPFCQAISYTAGITTSFVLNRSLTFRDGIKIGLTREAGRFLLVNVVSLLAGVVGIHLLLLTGLPTFLAKTAITVVTAVINYFGYKWFVFQIPGGSPPAS